MRLRYTQGPPGYTEPSAGPGSSTGFLLVLQPVQLGAATGAGFALPHPTRLRCTLLEYECESKSESFWDGFQQPRAHSKHQGGSRRSTRSSSASGSKPRATPPPPLHANRHGCHPALCSLPHLVRMVVTANTLVAEVRAADIKAWNSVPPCPWCRPQSWLPREEDHAQAAIPDLGLGLGLGLGMALA